MEHPPAMPINWCRKRTTFRPRLAGLTGVSEADGQSYDRPMLHHIELVAIDA
jgi:hypothetical protein